MQESKAVGAHVQVEGWISAVKLDRIAYPACTLQNNGKQCNKKVEDNGGGDGPDRWCALLCSEPCTTQMSRHPAVTRRNFLEPPLRRCLTKHRSPLLWALAGSRDLRRACLHAQQVLPALREDLRGAVALHAERAAGGLLRPRVGHRIPGACRAPAHDPRFFHVQPPQEPP
jgi:hypothetical protein